ncbi:endonuclease/exonuclease/phosphatase family protein [Flavobacterium agricola]|uniref:Endonuclease/exonuclease/phosphatase family protein n=1 Tax=Flavobacterium agricola TaxID=2870839 RepID=A0ABY6LXJ0_9FLAO|nr:endonuclease/exonuclease/phosphatase family protein [Flavobacterium agricola]UYW01053.1 endonuclease/exonuclease/phosphatase family protein [Flavobacterium agricola]
MKNSIPFLFVLLFLGVITSSAQDKKFQVHTVAFYNVENLFDTIKGTNYDQDWLPSSGWTSQKYNKKINNLAFVISQIGTNATQHNSPVLIGVAEVENRSVLEDLVKAPNMVPHNYGVIHFDSPDKRGIDVGLLYKKNVFTPISYSKHPLYIYENLKPKKTKKESVETDLESNVNYDPTTKRVYTRDQLLVTGLLDGEEVHVIVNHWPSRSGGEKRSSPFREKAADLNKKIIDSLYVINPKAKIITMGDLNDGPYNKSVTKNLGAVAKRDELVAGGIFNPMYQMYKDGMGTIAYRDAWDIFDQILVSEPLARKTNNYDSLRYWKAGIYNPTYLQQKSGQYKGYPLRNSNNEPGYSDHFPVYIYLIKEHK